MIKKVDKSECSGTSTAEHSKPIERQKRVRDIVGDILGSKVKLQNIPEPLIKRSFKKGSVKDLKAKFDFLLKVGSLDTLKKKFLEAYELLHHGVDKHYRTLHKFEMMFYILQDVAPEFLQEHHIALDTLKKFFADILGGYIKTNIANFVRGERDVKKLRKLFQFLEILQDYTIVPNLTLEEEQKLSQIQDYLETLRRKK